MAMLALAVGVGGFCAFALFGAAILEGCLRIARWVLLTAVGACAFNTMWIVAEPWLERSITWRDANGHLLRRTFPWEMAFEEMVRGLWLVPLVVFAVRMPIAVMNTAGRQRVGVLGLACIPLLTAFGVGDRATIVRYAVGTALVAVVGGALAIAKRTRSVAVAHDGERAS